VKPDVASIGRRALTAWVGLVARLAWLVLLLALALTVAALHYTVTHIGINTSTADMLSPELEFRKNTAARKEAFPQFGGRISVVVEGPSEEAVDLAAERLAAAMAADSAHFRSVFYPQSDPFFLENGLLYLSPEKLYTLSNRLAETQALLGALAEDPSLRGLAGVLADALEEGELDDEAQRDTFARALEKLALSAESVGGGRPEPLSWRNLMSGEEASEEDTRAFITAQPEADFGSLAPYAPAIEAVRAHARALGLTPETGIRVRITGEPAMVQDELYTLRSQMGLVGALSLTMVVVLLVVGLRHWQLLIGTVASLIMGLIWTAGFAVVAIGELNLISVAFAILFIGLSVDFGIHYALRYREAVAAGGEPRRALAVAAEGVGGALFLSAVAAAIGFLSFLPTDYRGVSELGLISGVGMFIALFANLTVLPAVLALLPLRRASQPPAGGVSWTWRRSPSPW